MMMLILSYTQPSVEACALSFSAVALGVTAVQFEETAGTLPDSDAYLLLKRECSKLSEIHLRVDIHREQFSYYQRSTSFTLDSESNTFLWPSER